MQRCLHPQNFAGFPLSFSLGAALCIAPVHLCADVAAAPWSCTYLFYVCIENYHWLDAKVVTRRITAFLLLGIFTSKRTFAPKNFCLRELALLS